MCTQFANEDAVRRHCDRLGSAEEEQDRITWYVISAIVASMRWVIDTSS